MSVSVGRAEAKNARENIFCEEKNTLTKEKNMVEYQKIRKKGGRSINGGEYHVHKRALGVGECRFTSFADSECILLPLSGCFHLPL